MHTFPLIKQDIESLALIWHYYASDMKLSTKHFKEASG